MRAKYEAVHHLLIGHLNGFGFVRHTPFNDVGNSSGISNVGERVTIDYYEVCDLAWLDRAIEPVDAKQSCSV